MAIVGCSTTRIQSGALGNKDASSVAGVPGHALDASYARVDLDVKLAATDTGALYVALSNGYVRQTNMVNVVSRNNPWHLFAQVSLDPFTLTIPNGTTDLWPYGRRNNHFGEWEWWNGASSTSFTGDTTFPSVADPTSESDATGKGYELLPFNLSQLDKETSESGGVVTTTGKLNLLLPILYQWTDGVTSPITLGSVEFSVDVSNLVLYYPFAIRKSGTMRSADRAGGFTRIRKSGQWRDVKNSEAGGTQQHGLVRRDGSWTRAPRIGAS